MADAIGAEFGISQPAVSQHLQVLRDNGFATVRPEGTRRLYAVDPAGMREVDAWLEQFRVFWTRSSTPSAPRSPAGRRPADSTPTESVLG